MDHWQALKHALLFIWWKWQREEGSKLLSTNFNHSVQTLTDTICILKMYYYACFTAKGKLSKIKSLALSRIWIEVWLLMVFLLELNSSSLLLLLFQCMAEFWLVLRGEFRILREAEGTWNSYKEMSNSIVVTRITGKIQPDKSREVTADFLFFFF